MEFHSYVPACETDTKQHLNNKYLLNMKVAVKPPGQTTASRQSLAKARLEGEDGARLKRRIKPHHHCWKRQGSSVILMALMTAHVSCCFLSTAGGCSLVLLHLNTPPWGLQPRLSPAGPERLKYCVCVVDC